MLMYQGKQRIRNQTQTFQITVYSSFTYSVLIMYLNIFKAKLIIFTFTYDPFLGFLYLENGTSLLPMVQARNFAILSSFGFQDTTFLVLLLLIGHSFAVSLLVPLLDLLLGVTQFFFSSILFFFFKLKDNCFTEWCWFLPDLNMDQPWVYIWPLPLYLAPTSLPILPF